MLASKVEARCLSTTQVSPKRTYLQPRIIRSRLLETWWQGGQGRLLLLGGLGRSQSRGWKLASSAAHLGLWPRAGSWSSATCDLQRACTASRAHAVLPGARKHGRERLARRMHLLAGQAPEREWVAVASERISGSAAGLCPRTLALQLRSMRDPLHP